MDREIRHYQIEIRDGDYKEFLYVQVNEDKTIVVSKHANERIDIVPNSKEITHREYTEALGNKARQQFKPINLESRIENMKE